MTKRTKILASIAGVLAVGAVVGGAYFINVGGLQGCVGRGCLQRSVPVDLSISGLSVSETEYSGVPYYRVTAGLKSTAPESEWKVTLNGNDYTQTMGWKSVPAKANTPYSFDIMQKVACEGISAGTRSISINLDPNNKITESKEGNNTASVNFECKNAAVINSVQTSTVSQYTYFTDGKSVEKVYEFILVMDGKNLQKIKAVSVDDSTLGVPVFKYDNDDVSRTYLSPTDATFPGIKKVTYTDALGFKQTFSVELKLPIKPEAPIITGGVVNGTLSLSNPNLTWDTSSKTADPYAYVDGKFVHSYFYEVNVFNGESVEALSPVSDSDPSNACFKKFYAAEDLNKKEFGSQWMCNAITIPSKTLNKLKVGTKYMISIFRSNYRPYGQFYDVLEMAVSNVVVTVVK
jgi:hypothetical protein